MHAEWYMFLLWGESDNFESGFNKKNIDYYYCDYKSICSILATGSSFNPLKPEFTIVIFIHYKPRIAAAILDL